MSAVVALGPSQILAALKQALGSVCAYPLRWCGLVCVFLVCVEAITFIPYVGFTAKLAVAGVVGAQWLVLFERAAHGHAPRLGGLWAGFSLPASHQLTLATLQLLPFGAGIALLWRLEPGAVGYFFGSITTQAAPSQGAFLHFKLALQALGAAFVFVPPALVLCGLDVPAALRNGLRAAWLNLPFVSLSLALNLAFEHVSAALHGLGVLGVVLAIALLLGFVTFSAALTHAAAARVLAPYLRPAASDSARPLPEAARRALPAGPS